jgi:hypothetical protein
MTPKHPPGPPITLGDMREQNSPAPSPNVGDVRWLGAKSVTLLCRACSHQQVVSIEILPDEVPLELIASKFICRAREGRLCPSLLEPVSGN